MIVNETTIVFENKCR